MGQDRIPKYISVLLILLFAWRIAVSANQVASLSIAFSFLIAMIWQKSNVIEKEDRSLNLLIVLLSFLPCVIEGAFIPTAPFPDYPALGKGCS